MGDVAKIRSFIAIELPDDILSAIRELQKQLKSEKLNLRWVEPGNIHLTLKFLGEIGPKDLFPISEAMKKAVSRTPAFHLYSKGIGAFPGLNRPRVLWTGIGGETESLEKLVDSLDDELGTLGFERENRLFKGHLTIARAKGPVDPVRMTESIGRFMRFKTNGFTVREVMLFRSRLKPGGPVYEKLFEAPLEERANT
jgi:RNA 2',3'-cyclic 3'-phosphodiesterase